MNLKNYEAAFAKLDEAKAVQLNLETDLKNRENVINRVNLLKTLRYTGFLGFLIKSPSIDVRANKISFEKRNWGRQKTNGPSWTHETLKQALAVIRNGTTFYAASSQYKIPRATLFDHMSGRRGQKSNSLGSPTALTADTEKTLVNLIGIMEKNGFGLSRKEVVEHVAEYVKHNIMKLPFKDGIPGYDCFAGFVSRHNLSIKKHKLSNMPENRLQIHLCWMIISIFSKRLYINYNCKINPTEYGILTKLAIQMTLKRLKLWVNGDMRRREQLRKHNCALCQQRCRRKRTTSFIIFKGKNVWSEWTSPEAYPAILYTATENGG
ncbi:unnamed protein product [Colias eurytheme]|nr:unnamed protein product [Colias eurytheme]